LPRLPINVVTPGQTIDLYLVVTSPNGHRVPIADYIVEYAVDGTFLNTSQLGHRSSVNPEPSDDHFHTAAAITGWFESINEDEPMWGTATYASYERPYALDAFSLDTTRPDLTFDDPNPAYQGQPTTLTGTADDDHGIARIHLYEGPTLIASSDLDDLADGVALIEIDGTTWTLTWTPTTLGTHHLTVIANDHAGNQNEASHDADVTEPSIITITFVTSGIGGTLTYVSLGETIILTGEATIDGFDTSNMSLGALNGNETYVEEISTNDIVVEDGMWRLPWTAPQQPRHLLSVVGVRRRHDVGALLLLRTTDQGAVATT